MAHAVTGPFDVIAFAEVPDLVNCQSSFLRRFRMWGGASRRLRRPWWLRRMPPDPVLHELENIRLDDKGLSPHRFLWSPSWIVNETEVQVDS
jgi:hypothetical protein